MAGSVTITGNKNKVEISWIANADGSVPQTDFGDTIIANIQGRYCLMAVTDPGVPVPTDQYDIEIRDEYGVDVFGGKLNNRSSVTSEQAVPQIGDGLGSRLCAGPWTFHLIGNSINAAQGKCVLYFEAS
jgi:hypothetical protein